MQIYALLVVFLTKDFFIYGLFLLILYTLSENVQDKTLQVIKDRINKMQNNVSLACGCIAGFT